jgi:hypothetical protein
MGTRSLEIGRTRRKGVVSKSDNGIERDPKDEQITPTIGHEEMPSRATPEPVHRAFAAHLVELELVSFSWEDRHALWFGLVLTFSSGQLSCFKVLWNNFLRGNLPIPNERILCGLRGNTTHVYHLFKRHAAWKQVIAGDGRGNFWLRFPSQGGVTTFAPVQPEFSVAPFQHSSPNQELPKMIWESLRLNQREGRQFFVDAIRHQSHRAPMKCP